MNRIRRPRIGPPPSRVTTDGGLRWHVTVVLDESLFRRLELYRSDRHINRSDAIRRILTEHLTTTDHAD